MKVWTKMQQFDRVTMIIATLYGYFGTMVLYSLPFVHVTVRSGLFLIIINSILSMWIGWHLRQQSAKQLWVWPFWMLVALSIYGPHYSYLLPVIYLAESYLVWSMTKPSASKRP